MMKQSFFMTIILLVLSACNSFNNSEIIRNDLLRNIKEFIKYSEENAKKIGADREDTNIYWVEFFEKDKKNMVVLMQQPYYDSMGLDGYLKINENLMFFYNSDKSMVETSRLNHKVPKDMPDENSKESGLGFSAPNWAYIITESGLEKTFIGE